MISLNSANSVYNNRQYLPANRSAAANHVHCRPEFHSWATALVKKEQKVGFQALDGFFKGAGKAVKDAFDSKATRYHKLLKGELTVKQVAEEMAEQIKIEPDMASDITSEMNSIINGNIEIAKKLTRHLSDTLKQANNPSYMLFDIINKRISSSVKHVEKIRAKA